MGDKIKRITKPIIVLFTQNFQLFIILGLICYISIFDKWTLGEIRLTIEFIVIIFLLALGHTFIMLVGEIDLALPNTMILSSVLYVVLSRTFPPLFALLIITLAILISTWIYGWTVAKLSINSLAFSLGLLFIIQYMIYYIFRYDTLRENNALQFIKPVESVEIQLLLAGTAGLLSFILLQYSKWGIWLRAVGSRSKLFQSLIGKRSSVVALAYACAGILAVLAAIIKTARFYGAQTSPDKNMLFYSIGAAILGGVRLTGGRGNVWMALQGSVIVGIIVKHLQGINISSDLRLVVFGVLVLLISCYSESLRRKIYDFYSIV